MPPALATNLLRVLESQPLRRLPWLIHGFSTRRGGFSRRYGGGALNLGFTRDDSSATVRRNRRLFLEKLGARRGKRLWPLVTVRQIHSDLIHCIASPPRHQLTGDGLITATPEILLAVQAADCLPVILVDVEHRAVGAFHAGWRGTVKRILEKAVGEMHRQFRSEPRRIRAAIGPGIHGCCYEVGAEVREKFASQFAYASDLFREAKGFDPVREKPMSFLCARPPGHNCRPIRLFLDLVEANRRQLVDAGVPPTNITASRLCTACHRDLLFSHRADKAATGRMLGVVGIRATMRQGGLER
jgi:polyphenol oxidase